MNKYYVYCCAGRYKHSGGFKWKYKEDYDKERTQKNIL